MYNNSENELSFYRVLEKRVTYKLSLEVCDYMLSETGVLFLDTFG